MNDPSLETVALERIGRPTDLWPAVESAQFARVIIHEAVSSDDDERAIEEFIDAFNALVENWEEQQGRNRAFMFESVETRIRALEQQGLFVHYACIERTIAEPDRSSIAVLPVAVIRIGRSTDRSTTVELPGELLVDGIGGDEDDDGDEDQGL